jgi:hypothetical protein
MIISVLPLRLKVKLQCDFNTFCYFDISKTFAPRLFQLFGRSVLRTPCYSSCSPCVVQALPKDDLIPKDKCYSPNTLL